MRNNDFIKGHTYMFIATLFFSMNFLALKYLLPTWMSGYDATFFRIVGALVLFWITSLFVKGNKIEKKDAMTILMSGLFGLFPFMIFFNMAIEYSSVIDVSIIMTTPPVIIAIASIFVYKTKISLKNGIGLFLSIGGAIFLILIGGSNQTADRSLMGNIFAIISACCYAFYLMSLKKCSEKYHPISLLKWVFLAATLGAIPLGVIFLHKAPIMHHPDSSALLVLAFVILFPSFLSFLLIPPAIHKIGHQLVSMYQDLIPVLATIMAISLKMAKLYWDQPVAIVIILIGVYISSSAVKREQFSKESIEPTQNK